MILFENGEETVRFPPFDKKNNAVPKVLKYDRVCVLIIANNRKKSRSISTWIEGMFQLGIYEMSCVYYDYQKSPFYFGGGGGPQG